MTNLKETILHEAVNLATKFTLGGATRQRVAAAARCGVGTVNYHYGSMQKLHNAIITFAIEHERLPLLALYVGVPKIERRFPPELKQRVVAYIAGK